MDNNYDVIVVGGGHAGTEAACAAARTGANTLLVTHNIDTIGQMSCNPAIGGIGKTHLVKEIDALGGVMAQAIDRAAIHVRVLNESKGPAVQATRMQADRMLYKMAIRSLVENQPNLTLFQQAVDDLLVENGRVVGLRTQLGITFYAPAVVLTVGTFLAGKIHVGLENRSGGRSGDPASTGLAACLREMALPVGRLKTGTPPRIAGHSIDFDSLTAQPSSHPDLQMAYYTEHVYKRPAQLPCYLTRTTPETHAVIRDHLGESPMFSGAIEGKGPRYCPSIEDKITRFEDRDHHSIFLEPEGHCTQEYYPNGISTSLPYHAQVAFVRSIPGLSKAQITRPGYAIEYDFFDPRCLTAQLSLKEIPNLFFAGQINGTTGYEEAGAQGLLAGLNAALQVQGKMGWTPGRDQAYLGVLVDDLITQGTKEPYRMFTSRAEYRLQLRQDNADNRLTEKGHELGLVSEGRYQASLDKKNKTDAFIDFLKKTKIKPNSLAAKNLYEKTKQDFSEAVTLYELMKRPEINCDALLSCEDAWKACVAKDSAVLEQVDCHFRYAGYLVRQQEEIARQKKHEHLKIPADFDYATVTGLSNEAKQKLLETKPENIGQASRIPGVTPAAIALLLVHLKKKISLVGFKKT